MENHRITRKKKKTPQFILLISYLIFMKKNLIKM